jgi:hypothetical protein
LSRPEWGGALVLVLLVLLLFTLLGAAAVQMGANEIEQSGLQAAQQEAGYLAESGIELAVGWFARPETFAGRIVSPGGPCPAPARTEELLAKRCRRHSGRASFSTDGGESQFQGTPSQPDGAISLTAAELFSHVIGPASGGTIDVILFGPTTLGAVCTVQSTGRTAGGASRTIRVEFYEAAAPTFTAAAGAGEAGPAVGPVRLHWGGLRYEGDGRLPADPDEVPVATPLAPVDGRPYGAPDRVDGRLDQWMQVVIGGRLLEPAGDAAADAVAWQQWTGRGNVRIGAGAPTDVDAWPYRELKRLARRFGQYYTTDQQGWLYRDGQPPAMEADAVFGAIDEPASVLFIDTIDGQPPRLGPGGNLPTITLSRSTGSPRAYIGGHLVLAPSDPLGDAPLTVLSPLADGGTVALEGVVFSGGFFVAGRLTVERESRLFGAIYAAGGFEGTERLELWYDRRFGDGAWPGWPVVSILPGSWRLVAQ